MAGVYIRGENHREIDTQGKGPHDKKDGDRSEAAESRAHQGFAGHQKLGRSKRGLFPRVLKGAWPF